MKKRSRREDRTESGRMLQSPTDRLFERHFRGVLDESTATWRVIPEFISQGGTVLLRPCRSEMIDRGFFVAGKSTGGIKNEVLTSKGHCRYFAGQFRKMAIYRKKGTCIIQKISLSGNENADF